MSYRRIGLAGAAILAISLVAWYMADDWRSDRRPDQGARGETVQELHAQTSSPVHQPDHAGSSYSSVEPLPVLAAFSNERFTQPFKRDLDRLDPLADGWDTEAMSDQATSQLKRLGKFLVNPDSAAETSLTELLTDNFVSGWLKPPHLSTVFEDATFLVRRATSAEAAEGDVPGRGQTAWSQAVDPLVSDAVVPRGFHVHFKVYRVEKTDSTVKTSSHFQLGGQTQTGTLQINSHWHCQWQVQEQGALKLASIHVDEYEEVYCKQSTTSAPLLADCTEAVIGSSRVYREQLTRGLDHWGATIDRRLGIDITGTHGLAIGDVDGDGLEDVFICEPGGLPNRLLLHKPDGTARDVSAVAGIDFLEPTRAALLLDLDNDGDQDLVMASDRFVIFMANDGFGRFQQRTGFRTSALTVSLAAADFDQDSDLDVYVCGYLTQEDSAEATVGLGNPIPFHDANNGGRNVLLQNDGNWNFVDATKQVGLDEANSRFSFAAAWQDFDGDGDPDLYVANDYGRNCLYRNDAARFVNVAAEAGVEDISSGMSVSWGDFNRDGLPDIYVSNMFSSAGNRISYHRQFKTDVDLAIRNDYRRFARGNTLFQNVGDGTFRDVTSLAGVAMGRWAWCSNFVDLNNDGWEDLLVTNGMLTREQDTGDL